MFEQRLEDLDHDELIDLIAACNELQRKLHAMIYRLVMQLEPVQKRHRFDYALRMETARAIRRWFSVQARSSAGR